TGVSSMRTTITILAILALLAPLHAQAPAAPAPLPAAQLDEHLKAWYQTMAGISGFNATFTLKRTEGVFDGKQEYSGTVRVLKPNFADLTMTSKGETDRYLCTGTSVFAYSSSHKSVAEYPAPNPNGSDNLMLDLLGGLDPAKAKKRFDITLTDEPEHYIVL